jgi:hypothetical protein
MIILFFSFFVFQSCLPFEADDSSDDLPFEANDPDDPPPDFDDDIISPTPEPISTPTLPPVKRTFSEILSFREALVFTLIFLYLFTYFVGRSSIRRKLAQLTSKLLISLRRHFAMGSTFTEWNVHMHRSWLSGRVGYKGAVVTAHLRRACDPLGIIYSVFRGQSDTFSIEFLLIPPHLPAGIIHIAKETPSFAERLKLKAFPLENKYKLWTDIGEMAESFVQNVRKFIVNYPTALELIELSDTNRFDARAQCRFVARFEFKICGSIELFVTDEMVDFCVGLADEFCVLKLNGKTQQKNQLLRETLTKEKETEKEEKKPTAEEEEKAQRKKERKEQKKLNPKVKVVRT